MRGSLRFGPIVGERHIGVTGKQQHSGLMPAEALPEVVGIGPGQLAPFARGPGRNGWQLILPARHDGAIAPLQPGTGLVVKAFVRALRNLLAGLLQQPFQIARPGMAIGIDNERQLPQQMRTTQAMLAVRVRETGSPTVMNDHTTIARNDAELLDGRLAPPSMQELQGDLPGGIDMNSAPHARTSSLTLPAAHKASNPDLTLSTSARTDCLSTVAMDTAGVIR